MKCDSAVYCKQKTTKIHSKTKHARIILKICPFTCDDLMRRIRAIKGEKESYFYMTSQLSDWLIGLTQKRQWKRK
jgi:hypothetical protein